MNRVFLTLAFTVAPFFAATATVQAQSSDVPVVEVPEVTSDEAILEAVEIPTETASDGNQLPEPGLDPSARLSPAVIEAWLDDPTSLLTSNPSAGVVMERYVALLAGSDARSIDTLIVLASHALSSRLQIRAIARGLASATLASEQTAPDYAAYIMFQVAASGNTILIDEFNRALRGAGDIETADLPGPIPGPATVATAPGTGSLTGTGDPGSSGSLGGAAVVGASGGLLGISGGSVGSVGDVLEVDRDVSPVRFGG